MHSAVYFLKSIDWFVRYVLAESVFGKVTFNFVANFTSTAFSMQRTSMMTTGFVLIFFGIQLALVDSYLLTPRIANFLSEQGGSSLVAQSNPQPNVVPQNQYSQSPFRQAGYQQPQAANAIMAATVPESQRTITPPRWLCWPMLFCGTVVLLQGLSKPRD